LNGSTKGDEMGEYTFIGGRGGTIIDYVLGNKEVRDKVERMYIGDRIDSDHQPVEVWIRGENIDARRRQRGRGERIGGTWDKEECGG
jgi:hypothetical protein